MRKYYIFGIPVTFIIVFNLGYVFHDLLMGEWLHEKEAEITRDAYIIPIIALSFFLYTIIQSFLFPIFQFYSYSKYRRNVYITALIYGALIGFLWDALQGGLIEYATFKMPLQVVFVDSGFHIVEGIYTALILAFFYKKYYV